MQENVLCISLKDVYSLRQGQCVLGAALLLKVSAACVQRLAAEAFCSEVKGGTPQRAYALAAVCCAWLFCLWLI
jgi:hypothetical protein